MIKGVISYVDNDDPPGLCFKLNRFNFSRRLVFKVIDLFDPFMEFQLLTLTLKDKRDKVLIIYSNDEVKKFIERYWSQLTTEYFELGGSWVFHKDGDKIIEYGPINGFCPVSINFNDLGWDGKPITKCIVEINTDFWFRHELLRDKRNFNFVINEMNKLFDDVRVDDLIPPYKNLNKNGFVLSNVRELVNEYLRSDFRRRVDERRVRHVRIVMEMIKERVGGHLRFSRYFRQ